MRKAYPDDLTDKEWEQIKPLIKRSIIVMLGENRPILA